MLLQTVDTSTADRPDVGEEFAVAFRVLVRTSSNIIADMVDDCVVMTDDGDRRR